MYSDREGQRLNHVIENADAVAGYLSGMTFEGFVESRMTIDATERCMQRLTEAIIQIGDDRMAILAPDVPVRLVRGLGNLLRHEYANLDLQSLYYTMVNDIPIVRAACLRALEA